MQNNDPDQVAKVPNPRPKAALKTEMDLNPARNLKFALESIFEALAAEMAPRGANVLQVEPGAFRTGLAGAAMRHMRTIGDYQDVVGPMRVFARSMNESQEGDPRKAAEAIEQALDAQTTPLRLQLGADAISANRRPTETLLTDLAAWEPVALATKLAPPAS